MTSLNHLGQQTGSQTLEQVLQQAIAYHRAGQLTEAERLYRSVLRARPDHPDANHNLGVLAIQVGRTATALPLFRSALQFNACVEQYWLSYADALLQIGDTKEAIKVVRDAEQSGFNTPEIQALRQKIQATYPGTDAPAPAEIEQLITLFKAGNYAEVESRSLQMVKRHPHSGFVWKVLRDSLQAQGKDALYAARKTSDLSPQDAEAHLNLSVALRGVGKLDESEALGRRALEIRPDYAEAHNSLGNTLSALGQLEGSLECYRHALEIKPGFAEANNNLGNVLKNLGRHEDALACYRRALEIRPRFAEAHNNLGNVLKELGQPKDALACYQHALEIKPGFVEAHNNLGNAFRDLGQLDDAAACFRRALEIKSDFAEAHDNLGSALLQLGQPHEALKSYQRALEIRPDYAEAHNGLGNALRSLGQPDSAAANYLRALEIKPDYADAHNNLGSALLQLEQLDYAVASFRRALEIRPDYAEAHSNLGSVLMNLGNMEEAEISLNKGIELAPDKAKSLLTLLNLSPYQLGDRRFEGLEAAYAQRESLQPEDRILLGFAMGKAMENIGQYDRSFAAYEEANQLHYRKHPSDEVALDHMMKDVVRVFTADLFKEYAATDVATPPADKRVPVFIVGMPRSGTTLIEQILASHTNVFGAGEIKTLGYLARGAGTFHFEPSKREATLAALRKLGQEYIDQVWQLAPDASHITNKMPDNSFLLGLIHLMLPNAKIIHAVRNPMDTCFSCYSLHFDRGLEYSYDLEALGRQYLRYRKVMAHWHQVLPAGRILNLEYEENVADPERAARRMLEHIGLPWDPACLRFYETRRTVRTASSTQVRRPIYSDSIARWQRFEQYLAPLAKIINSAPRE